MGLFQQFPYSNFHDLNLDWLINQIKEMGNQAVLSVNGQTGDVILYQSENIVFPEVDANTWRMVRIADGHTAGVMFQNGLMYVMFDNAAERVYTVEHPPAYPVTSVDGQTGDVTVFPDAATRLPDVTDDYTNIRRQIRTAGTDHIVGIELKADKVFRMDGTTRAQIYDAMNPPPYPVTSVNGQTGDVTVTSDVTSVNGQTGAVVIAVPFANVSTADVMFTQAVNGHEWSIGRETLDGVGSIQIRTDSSKAEAWIDFFTEDTPQVTYSRKLLTTDDIPSSSGVISINGLSGVVTLTGTDIKINANSQVSIDTKLADIDAELLSQGGDITDIQDDISDIQDDVSDLQTAIANVGASGDGLAYIVDGDTAPAAVPAGAYAFLKNNTHGLANGFYTNDAYNDFPVSGGTADSTVFTAIGAEGILNQLVNNVLSASWTASSSSSSGEHLTNNVSLTPGLWILIAQLPICAVASGQESATGIGFSDDTAVTIFPSGAINSTVSYNHLFAMATVTSNVNAFVRSAANRSVTYTYIDRGGIIAVKIK